MLLRNRCGLMLVLVAAACKQQDVPLATPNNPVTPATHTKFPIASGVHAVSCDSCHGGFASFQQFTCLNCHAHGRALTDELHRSVGPDYAYASDSCLSCHATGARVAFDHRGVTSACATCHDSGKEFDPLPVAGRGLDGGSFVHPDKGGNDCGACHVIATWVGARGAGAPDGVRDPSQDVVVAAEVPSYAGTSITALALRNETLPMPMFHSSPAAASVDCATCHSAASSGVLFPGRFHASLSTQPATCLECHAGSAPVGFVGPIDAARAPASGAMKHDAVLWSNGARTTTPAVPQECSLCHRAPPASAGWATSLKFHASVGAQPASCLDCHANSRPALLTSVNAALPAGVQFDHSAGAALGECATCHTGSFTSWSGGKFHLAGSATPSSCLPCHEGERPTSTAGWTSATYPDFPFDYGTHGSGLDCETCHAGPGNGSWGGTQNWVGGNFSHAPSSLGATCLACHATQRPDLVLGQTAAAALLPGRFDHAVKGTADCFSCHQNANTSAAYFNASATLPGGGWAGGIDDPDGVRDPTQDIVVLAELPTYAGTSIASVTAQREALPMPMVHSSGTIPQSMSCSACHAGAATGTFLPGRLHASLTTAGIAQPTACLDCHAASAPAGFVGAIDARRSPGTGEMKHDAVLWSNGVRTTTPAAPLECALCHLAPPTGLGWATSQKFHASIAAQPTSCLDCHANSRPTVLLTSTNAALPAGLQFDHSTATAECATCHTNGSFTSWTGGKFHLARSATPSSCVPCHQNERPNSTTGWVSSTWRTAPFDFATHGAGLDCATCHTGPGTGAWGGAQNWVGGNFGHSSSSLAASTCIACHATQRPDVVLGQATAASLLPGNFDHAVRGNADCISCHRSTTSYARYFNASGSLPGGDWAGGIGTPDGVRDPSQDVLLTAAVPTYSGTSIVSVTPQAEALPMPMFHSSATVPASMSCSACHAGAASGTYFPGRLHASLTMQPTACLDCHAGSAPAGFVGPMDPRRSPATGEMKHDAVLWSNGAPKTTPAVPQDCVLCHQTSGWATSQKFHAAIASQPSSCLDCHANSRPTALITSANAALPAGVQFDHSTATADCFTCHAGSFASWTGGKFHLAGSTPPMSCLPCHQGERPNSTTGWVSSTWQTAPFDFATHGAGLDCATCHVGPGTGAWGSTQNWVGGNFVHSVSPFAASNCIACHSTQRPTGLLTSTNAALLPGVQFDHSTATGECFTCHATGSFTSWTGGKLHLAGSATPSSCLPCHEGERPTSTAGWKSATYPDFPFDYGTHGAALDCATCHAGPGTGAWGGTQNWVGGSFAHAPSSMAGATCIACHTTQRPDLVLGRTAAAALLPGHLDHAVKGTADCFSCHQSANPTSKYFNPSGTLPGGGWQGGTGDPDGVRDPAQDIVVVAEVPAYAGTSIASVTAQRESLPMPMVHSSGTVPQTMSCSACHAGAATGTFFPGRLHASLATQPSTCLDCHAASAPTGFVGPMDARRSPGTGEMKHDAVLWSNGARTTTPAAPQECALCHLAPPTALGWATSEKFHASLGAQPTSCLDCHANSRPTVLLTSTNASLPPGVQFDHSTATAECFTCHVGSFTAWTGGKFHLAGSATPSSCLPCHQGERPNSTTGWVSSAWRTAPFDFATHGAGLDCVTCHTGPGTGAWGGTQNWVGGNFSHSSLSLAWLTCIACHATQRPDLVLGQATAASMLPGNFDHAVKGTADCFSCHRSTTSYARYFNASGSLPGGDWAGGIGTPDNVRDPSQDVLLTAAVPTYSGNSIVSVTAQAEALPMPMFHSSATVPPSTSCTTCHAGAASETYFPGRLHASLTTQPSACLDCHAGSVPTGFVGPVDARRSPATGEMKHDAVLWSNGTRTTTSAVPQECSLCHQTSGWATSQKFHAAAQPTSCLDCHANSRPTVLLTSANAALPAGVQFDHSTATADCFTCHASGSFSSWTGGKFHLAGSAMPSSCLPCHQGERPTSTAGWVDPSYRTSPFDFATHGAGLDCATCHTGPGSGASGGTQNWTGGKFSHSATSLAASTCIACHATQRPDLVLGEANAASLLPGNFDHAIKGTADCFSCHQATVAANTFVKYFNSAGTLPGGDWGGGVGAPDGVRDRSRDVAVTAQIPTYTSTSITALTARLEMLPMPMFHSSPALPQAIACSSCHAGASAGVFFPGRLHSALTTLGLAQPSTCADCHATSAPGGFVGPTDAARTPPSPAMKHDAVLWSNGSPTATPAVPQECSLCHQPQGWATSQKLHASVRPASCLDCHANSRPAVVLTSANAALPPGVQFDHSAPAALGECAACHAGSFTSWTGGGFHLVGGTTPSTCLPCHQGERPTSTAGWISTTYQSFPFDYVTNAAGVTHGAGQDCVTCHAGPGTGSWGGTQNWAGGYFAHAASPVAGNTCIACHSTQRPDLVLGAATAAALLDFDHSMRGTGNCRGCHEATVAANAYVHYFNASGTLPGGDWSGGVSYPGSTLIGAPGQVIFVPETFLSRSPDTGLVTGSSTILATLYDDMLHVSAALPPALNAGPTDNPDPTKCWHCHTNTNGVVTSYTNGLYHSSLDNYQATLGAPVTPLPQPTGYCSDCHSLTRPSGIVEWGGSELQPMDHDAVFISGASANQIDCSSCHRLPGSTWTDGAFHAPIARAVPQDCTVCHYLLMADASVSDVMWGSSYMMSHQSSQLGFQSCQVCHVSALANATTTPLGSPLWSPGALHSSVAAQPTACLDCHASSLPAGPTQSSVSYALAAGATVSNERQWMSHDSGWVVGKDCVACHAADARPGATAWSNSVSFHAAVPGVTSCSECHGFGNMPAGLTDSSMVSSAAGDGGSGVPAGTHDQITHGDLNVILYECNICHTQAGASTEPGVQGREWAQASFHASFSPGNPLTIDGTIGRCSNCHMNVKPPPGFTVEDHSALSAEPGTPDCSSCHSWPGTGTPSAPNWLGAVGFPLYISVGGFTVPAPPAPAPLLQGGVANLPHPTVTAGTCTACHTSETGGKPAIGYDHAAAEGWTSCNACHEAGSNLVGTVWNGATGESQGAGDTRPFTLPSVYAAYRNGFMIVTWPNHFYNSGTKIVDCSECHVVPPLYGATTSGSEYLHIGSGGTSSTGVWAFPHYQSMMTNPDTCKMCHGDNIPIP